VNNDIGNSFDAQTLYVASVLPTETAGLTHEKNLSFSLLDGIRAWHEEKSMNNYILLRKCLRGEPKHLSRRNNAHTYEKV
jgi:hypothetical protein